MEYRCEATSVVGFVQQLVSCYLPHGYWFYVCGWVPEGKDPKEVDAKLIAKYGIGISRQSRARRKAMGIANVHYLRYQQQFVLLATHGHHPFFEDEERNIRDARRIPIPFVGYSIGVQAGGYLRKDSAACPTVKDPKQRVRVQISQRKYRELKEHFLDLARRRSAPYIVDELRKLPFEPYAPVRQQLLNLIRVVNVVRHRAGRTRIDPKLLRYQRQIVLPFAPDPEGCGSGGHPPAGIEEGKKQGAGDSPAPSEERVESGPSESDSSSPQKRPESRLDEKFLIWAAEYVDSEPW
jgi:hypothetical protein